MKSEMKAKDGYEDGMRRGRFAEVPTRHSSGGEGIPLRTVPRWPASGEN